MAEALVVEPTLASFLEVVPDAMVIVGADGLIALVNAQAEKMFGYPRAELVGHPVELLMPKGAAAAHPEHRARYFANPQVRAMGAALDLSGRRKDGTEFPVEVSLSPLTTDKGVLVSSAIRDVTERRKAEVAVATARDAAEAANRDLEAFSYSVAHDMRAPLRGIDGFSLALLEDYGELLDDEGRRYLRRVRESAQHMAQLIESLLSLAKVTRAQLQREQVDLAELARAAATELCAAQPERDIELVIQKELTVKGDKRLLGIALDNLISNAWKFTRDTPHARIELSRELTADRPVFCLRDNGAGFDMAFASRLFGVFQRLHTVAEFEGTGIGLATAQRIIQRHGGQIWAEGKVGEGAAFRFTLGDEGQTS